MNSKSLIKNYKTLFFSCSIVVCCLTLRHLLAKEKSTGNHLLRHNLYIDETPTCNFECKVYAEFLSRHIHYNLDSFEVFTKTLPFYNFDIDLFFKHANLNSNTDSLKYLITDTQKNSGTTGLVLFLTCMIPVSIIFRL